MWVSRACMYVFTLAYSGSSFSSADLPVMSEVVVEATPLKNFLAPKSPFFTTPLSWLAAATSACQAVSAASRKNWSSEENLSTGWAHSLLTKTLRAWHLLSIKSVPMEYFWMTSFSGRGGTITPGFFSPSFLLSQAKSLNLRITSTSP